MIMMVMTHARDLHRIIMMIRDDYMMVMMMARDLHRSNCLRAPAVHGCRAQFAASILYACGNSRLSIR